MAKFRKKPVVVEAVQFVGEPIEGVALVGCRYCWPRGCINGAHTEFRRNAHHGLIPTLEGDMEVSLNDWVITGVKGEKYPCKPDIFDAAYEKVED